MAAPVARAQTRWACPTREPLRYAARLAMPMTTAPTPAPARRPRCSPATSQTAQRHEHRRRAARDRIGLGEVAAPIRAHEERLVAQVAQTEAGDVGPGGGAGQADEGPRNEAERRRAEVDEGETRELVGQALGERVPQRVQGAGARGPRGPPRCSPTRRAAGSASRGARPILGSRLPREPSQSTGIDLALAPRGHPDIEDLWCSRSARRPVKAEVAGSNLVRSARHPAWVARRSSSSVGRARA